MGWGEVRSCFWAALFGCKCCFSILANYCSQSPPEGSLKRPNLDESRGPVGKGAALQTIRSKTPMSKHESTMLKPCSYDPVWQRRILFLYVQPWLYPLTAGERGVDSTAHLFLLGCYSGWLVGSVAEPGWLSVTCSTAFDLWSEIHDCVWRKKHCVGRVELESTRDPATFGSEAVTRPLICLGCFVPMESESTVGVSNSVFCQPIFDLPLFTCKSAWPYCLFAIFFGEKRQRENLVAEICRNWFSSQGPS